MADLFLLVKTSLNPALLYVDFVKVQSLSNRSKMLNKKFTRWRETKIVILWTAHSIIFLDEVKLKFQSEVKYNISKTG